MSAILKDSPKASFKHRAVKLSLHLSPETDERIENLAHQNCISKSEFLRDAIALYEVALKNKEKGYHLAVLDENDKKIGDIIGL